jgi:hypothetical protein
MRPQPGRAAPGNPGPGGKEAHVRDSKSAGSGTGRPHRITHVAASVEERLAPMVDDTTSQRLPGARNAKAEAMSTASCAKLDALEAAQG